MTNQYFLARLAGRDPNLRAADADRERIAERLRKSHAEGRLDMAEFQQRLEACYEAKTFGELDALVSDLPRDEQRAERRSSARVSPFGWRAVPLIPLLLIVLILASAAGHHYHFTWVWIPLVFIIWRMSWWRRRRWYRE